MKLKYLPCIMGLVLLWLTNNHAYSAQNQSEKFYASQNSSLKKGKTAVLNFKQAIEILYTKYQLSVITNRTEVNDLLIDRSLLEVSKDKIESSIRTYLTAAGYDFKKITTAQYLVSKTAAPQQPAIEKQKATYKVSGIVKDELGQVVQGASVRVAGTTKVEITNENGKYTINVEPTDILEFTFIGYKKQSIPVRNKIDINVTLEPEAGGLQEVAIIGFGKQKKVSVVGSQVTLKPEELKLPVRDLTTAIAGRLAGVVATQRSGAPGQDGASILIRGVSTFASSPQGPLLVVDGVPDRTINNIDPEDVESFTILKDASATAVYGTRGANGVILVNTKKGKNGKPQINAEFNQAITTFTALPKFVDGPTYMSLYNEALTTRGRNSQYSTADIDKTISGIDPDLYPNVNWYDQLFNDSGKNNRFTLNVNGGSENASYYISAGYYGETGMYKHDTDQTFNSTLKLDRFNFTSNVSANLTKTTKLDLGINGYITNVNAPSRGVNQIFSDAVLIPSVAMPARLSSGQWPQPQNFTASPLMYLTQGGYTNSYNNTIRSNIRATQDLGELTKGLTLTGMFAFDVNVNNNITRSRTIQTYYIADRNNPRDANGKLITQISQAGSNALGFDLTRYGDRRFYTEASLNYARKFGNHDIGGLLLFNQSDYSDATARVDNWKKAISYRQRSIVGRLTYGYKDKYFVESNFGYSGSEAFVPNKRYGFFPSLGAGWLVSNEQFFEPINDIISHLKVRYTYGLSGNASVNDANKRFLYLTTIGTGGAYYFGDTPSQMTGFAETQIGGDVSWETARRQNLGLEVNLLKNDLQFIVEFFKEKRTGILLPNYIIPYNSGFTTANIPYANIGETNNKGIDVTTIYNKNWTPKNFFTFRGSFNINKNLAVKDGLPPWQYGYQNRIGQSISQRFGYIALNYFKDQNEINNSPKQAGDVRPGDIRYKDLNGDGIINNLDQTAIGYGATPRIVYGLSFGGGFKGFDVSVFFQGAGMVDFNYAGGNGTTPFPNGNTYGNPYATMLDRWTEANPNQNALYPRLSTNQDNSQNYLASTHWIKSADYIRLKSAEIGYTFDSKMLEKAAIKRLRVFMNGTNLFTISKWKFWDPELGDGNGASYPNITTYNIGLRANFK
ncbi:MAG TPA: TonB-dependent receptor [Pedobacter sp.]|nr:TonB-dependent receptor [Pedobacter sp.]